MRKKTILMLSDHPLSTSGVGTQARWLINGLISTGNYNFRCFGGAVKHEDYNLNVINDNFIIKPTDGFGDRNLLRQTLVQLRPDALLLFTDPRFFIWVWEMADEIRQICPIFYWHLWDNYPWPDYNKVLYESTDSISCINWPTYQMIKERFPEKTQYIPHAVPKELYKPLPENDIKIFKKELLGNDRNDHFIVGFVSRNARRKMPGDIVVSWKMFLDELEQKHGHRKATLVMHTNPLDSEGPNLYHVVEAMGVAKNVVFSKNQLDFNKMSLLYNSFDTIVNRSCFASGTNVVTKDGYVPIEKIKIGTEVLTHKHRWRSVVDTIKNLPVEKILNFKISGIDDIKITPNHKIMAIKKAELPKGFLINENLNDFVKYVKMISASDLEAGDYVSYFSENRNITQEKTYNMYDLAVDENLGFLHCNNDKLISSHNTRNDVDHGYRIVKLDENLAYVLGEFTGDGSTNSSGVSFNKKDINLINEYSEKLTKSFGVKSMIYERDNCTIVSAQNGSVITKFLKKMCGSYSHGKQIPDDIMTSPNNIKKAFLEGYIAADGCYLKNKIKGSTPTWRCRTVSNKLAWQLKELLLALGTIARVHLIDNSYGLNKEGKIWTIEWNDIINNGYKFNGSCRSWVYENIVIHRIRKVEEINHNDYVYNLTVEEDHTYNVGAVVTNCNEGYGLPTLESMMCGKPIVVIKTGGLTRQVEDLETGEQFGIGLEPEVKSLVGNQLVPYIYEDFISHKTLVDAFMKIYEMGPEARKELGLKAMAHAHKDYDINDIVKLWDKTLTKTIDEWDLKHPKMWTHIEV